MNICQTDNIIMLIANCTWMAPTCNSKIMNVTASNKILYYSQLHSQL